MCSTALTAVLNEICQNKSPIKTQYLHIIRLNECSTNQSLHNNRTKPITQSVSFLYKDKSRGCDDISFTSFSSSSVCLACVCASINSLFYVLIKLVYIIWIRWNEKSTHKLIASDRISESNRVT